MMSTKTEILLWRVEWVHRAGMIAPFQMVWAKDKKEAIQLAKSKSRLTDFPEFWSIKLSLIPKYFKKKKKKELAS